eukprot:gene2437-2227_t
MWETTTPDDVRRLDTAWSSMTGGTRAERKRDGLIHGVLRLHILEDQNFPERQGLSGKLAFDVPDMCDLALLDRPHRGHPILVQAYAPGHDYEDLARQIRQPPAPPVADS